MAAKKCWRWLVAIVLEDKIKLPVPLFDPPGSFISYVCSVVSITFASAVPVTSSNCAKAINFVFLRGEEEHALLMLKN